MSYFVTRVQLDGNPTEATYEKLHAAMKAKGFSRFIKAENGTWYQLPHAEYVSERFASIDDALSAARAAAGSVQTGFKILVTEGIRLKWSGLKEVPAPTLATV